MFDQIYSKKIINIYNIILGLLYILKYVLICIFHKLSQSQMNFLSTKIKYTYIINLKQRESVNQGHITINYLPMQWHRLLIGYYTQNICDCTRCGVGLSIAVLLYGFHIFGGADKCKIPACCCRKEIIFASLLISSTRYVANDHSLHYIFKSTSTNHDALDEQWLQKFSGDVEMSNN